jgi:hypothetical protein
MIHVYKHRLAGALALLEHGIYIALEHIQNRIAPLRRYDFAQIGRVQMNGKPVKLVRYFFRLNEQELARPVEQWPEFIERLETNQRTFTILTLFNPRPKPLAVLGKRSHDRTAAMSFRVDPFIPLRKDIVVGQSQKIVPVLSVPLDNHLWKIVTVAPK